MLLLSVGSTGMFFLAHLAPDVGRQA